MAASFISRTDASQYPLLKRQGHLRRLIFFSLELTARCNNNCRHCYINLAQNDPDSKSRELTFSEIKNIADQAVSLGALRCVLTGGEPLLRDDFTDIYLYLKQKGLLVSVFTNATLINNDHVKLFKEFRPWDIEITVYGVTAKTYDSVARKKGSYANFISGVNLLIKNGIKFRMKAVVMRSNIHEFREIRSFCESSTKRPFRADCYLNLRHDYNEKRNKEIISERLSAVELGKILHKWTKKDLSDFKSSCANMFASRSPAEQSKPLFNCQAGKTGFTVSYDGKFKLCNSLGHRDYAYDLKKGKLAEAWNKFAPALLSKSSPGKEYLEKCGSCNLYGVCIWCPAFSYLEKSRIDSPVEYCCDMAHLKQSLLNS